MRRLSALLATAGLCVAVTASGQDATPPPALAPTGPAPATPAPTAPADPVAEPADPAPDAPAVEAPVVLDPKAPARTEINLDRRTQVTAGIGFSGPIGAAASL